MASSQTFVRRFLRHRAAPIGFALLASIVLVAMLAGVLFPAGPWKIAGRPFAWPGELAGFWMGTDALGRDIAAGLAYGARVSLAIGIAATIVGLIVGIVMGALAGYFGGWVDDVLMRITDAFQTIPPFLLAIVIIVIVKPTVTTIVIAIAVISWPTVARLVRAEFLRLRDAEFVQSCRVIGMSDARIIFTQILPNSLAPIIVSASVMVASAILIEAGLAFLGLGDPNVISWGTMVGLGRSEIRSSWYMALIPGAAIVLAVLALNLVGDALNDALNPRLRRR